LTYRPRTTDHLVLEWTTAIAKHDLLVVFGDHEKVALNPSLQIDQDLSHLSAAQRRHLEGLLVGSRITTNAYWIGD
jgi:hypothetical protein